MNQIAAILLTFFALSSSAARIGFSGDLANFALNLLREGTDANSSAILSPVSVAVTLAMTYLGAEGKTKEEIGNVLAKGKRDGVILRYYSKLMHDMSAPRDGCTLNSANKLFISKGIKILKAYEDVIKTKFGGNLKDMDFSKAAQAAKEINDWVEDQTNSKIKNLLSADDISYNTVFILVNAIYFKGDWKAKFSNDLTTKEPFYFAPLKTREVDMMKGKMELPYTEDKTAQVLKLPYKGDQISMYVFLPKEKFGLQSLIRSLTGPKILRLARQCSNEREVDVQLPKFKLEETINLNNALEKIGIKDAFDSSKANFPKIATFRDLRIFISEVVHKAFIEVNEEGVEAAASTFLEMVFMSARNAPVHRPVKFIANRPFMFVIMKHNVILFIGKIF